MRPQIGILLILVCYGSVGAVLFTPALPEIQRYFSVSVGQAQGTITAYLLGYALGTLPYGPIASRFGRKSALYIGIPLSILGALLAALSAPLQSFSLLIGARFLQALGGAGSLKTSYTMVADAYDQVRSVKIFSFFLVSFAVIPGVAVMIGGLLVQYLNWESCFYFLCLFGIFMLWLAHKLPETAPCLDKSPMTLSSVVAGYRLKLKNSRLILSSLIMGCGTAAIYLFAAKAPFIGIDLIGLSPEKFGLFNLIPPAGMIIGAAVSSSLAGKSTVLRIMLGGMIFCLAATAAMLYFFTASTLSAWALFAPIVFVYIGEAVAFANASAFGLSTAENKSNASAVMQFLNIGGSVIAIFVSQWIYPASALSLPLFFLFFFVAALGLWFRLKKFA